MKRACLSVALLLVPVAFASTAQASGLQARQASRGVESGGSQRLKWRIAELEGEVAALRVLANEQRVGPDRARRAAPALPGPALAAAAAPFAGLLGVLVAMRRRARPRAPGGT